MPNSPRMEWPYPTENQNPWYEAFKSLIAAMDSSGFAAREDRHLILCGGGTVSWTSPTLSWTSPIQITAAITGVLWQVPAGSVTLEDGQVLYATLSRGPVAGVTVSVSVANKVPSSDLTLVLAVRVGTRIYFRNGMSLGSGGSSSGGISPSGQGNYWGQFATPSDLPNVSGSSTQSAALEVGATAYVTGALATHQCTDATLGAAVWTRTGNYWGQFATAADLPNVAGSLFQSAALVAGATAYVVADTTTYQCLDATPGAAVWSMMGGGGIGAGTYIKFGPYSYTQAPVPVPEVIAQFTFDGSLVGAAAPYFAGVATPTFTVVGWARLYLYDLGPSGGPFGAPRLVSTLQWIVGGIMDLSNLLTVVSAAPGVDQILDTKRVYELAVMQSSLVGDTVYVGSVGLEVV